MRFRRTAAAATALLMAGTLASCRTNVGTAAWVSGQRITESDVAGYLTANAQSLPADNRSNRLVAPRTIVLQYLINQRLYLHLLQTVVGKNAPTLTSIDAGAHRDLGEASIQSLTRQVESKGYSLEFVTVVLRVIEMQNQLGKLEQAGINVGKALRDLDFPVSVNPRFGRWDAKTRSFDNHVVVPAYLTPTGADVVSVPALGNP